ncbi:MAG: DsbA family protein [Rhodospirillales bacterium]|nr:DsbA family protein [Rhodospirillales bacterium]
MLVDRRSLLALVAAGSAAGLLPRGARAAEDGPRAERFIGSPDAKTVVGEYFSLTCTHCAAFAQQTMPKIKSELIDTGKVRWVFHDFPLDQVALTAAMVARYLPVDRYEPFVNALFASQDRWAFARGVNSNDELAKMAALAGMSRATFDKAVADTDLRNWILQQQDADQKKWNVDSTPSFVVDGKKYAGEMSFEAFRKLLPAT